jgi:hypothetical protein
MDNLDENPVPALTELGGEPLLGSGFEAEPSDPDFTKEQTQPLEEGSL